MRRFILRRVILGLLVCMTVLVISFALTRVAGDPALAVAGPQAPSAQPAGATEPTSLVSQAALDRDVEIKTK